MITVLMIIRINEDEFVYGQIQSKNDNHNVKIIYQIY